MASALLGVISGSASSCSRLAELMSSGLLRLHPSFTPCATAVASRLMAAVASAARSRTASAELDRLLHPAHAAIRSSEHRSFISITMPLSGSWIVAAVGVCAGVSILESKAGFPIKIVRMKKAERTQSASAMIDARIKELGDWRGKTLARVRALIHEADPEIV